MHGNARDPARGSCGILGDPGGSFGVPRG